MKSLEQIQIKLQFFIKKYYTNEIIKGSIFFLSFGLLYVIITLFIEYFFWLEPLARTILFWLFILVEFSLLLQFILIPLFKLIGLQKRISLQEASILIGKHFKEIDDKLLNVLQLTDSNSQSDLLLASIEQKSKSIQPIPFRKAINFGTNIKYIKYLAVPLIIWIVVFITGNNSVFTRSLDRVVHHKIAYLPPAPFSFIVLNKNLQAVEGKSYKLKITTKGEVVPDGLKINFKNESYFLENKEFNSFIYDFNNPVNSLDFYLEANGVKSEIYSLEVVKTPKILNFEMILEFPSYLGKKKEIIQSTGNAIIPEGTKVIWNIGSQFTNRISFISNSKIIDRSVIENLTRISDNQYSISKKVNSNIKYQMTSSNAALKNHETFNYHIQVIKDEFPKIYVKSDIDSVSRGPVQFIGQLSDDYGISKLQVNAKNLTNNVESVYSIDINKLEFEEFYYLFPKGLILEEGVNYEIHFEVFDNDAIHGRKKTKSKTFYYNNKTEEEINEELLREQKENYENLNNSSKSAEKLQRSLDEFAKKIKNKNSVDWNDKKQMDAFLKRQKNYQNNLKRNSEKLLQNLNEMDKESDPGIEERKQELKKRIEESKELQEKEELLRELEELAEKLQKEGLLEKIERLSEQNIQEKRSLERILELTKRFYVEKKSIQIIEKLKELSEEQEDLINDKNNNIDKQLDLNSKFDSIQKDFNDLEKQNKKLKDPMFFPDTKVDRNIIKMDMNKAVKNLDREEDSESKSESKKSQKSASDKMKELSKKLKSSMMQMEMEGSEENIKDLEQIIDNLLIFSFGQEELMLSFEDIDSKNAEYPDKLKKQQLLKEYFEHVDDSLYTLSLRMVKISSKIQKDLTDAHYNLDKSLFNISENKINEGMTNMHYTMIAANNLANLLSFILEGLKNKTPGNGQGKGKRGEELSLPDIIKKQGELIKKMEGGSKSKKGKKGEGKEEMSGEQFEIYQKQNQLREELNDLINKNSKNGNSGSKAVKQMEELEKMLLEKGFTNEVLDSMKSLMHELLKLEKATFEQNRESKRKSESNTREYNMPFIKSRNYKHLEYGQDEILIRKNLPLQPAYQNKVKLYFNEN